MLMVTAARGSGKKWLASLFFGAGRFQEVAELKFPSAKSKWSVFTIIIQPTVQVGCYAAMFPSD